MKLLILSAVSPYPPHDGDRLRLFHFLKALKLRGHVVDLFCLSRTSTDAANAECLRPWLRRLHVTRLSDAELLLNVVGSVFHEKSWNVASYYSPKFRKALEEYASSPEGRDVEAVFAHRLRMAPYADAFIKKRAQAEPKKIPWVLDLVDCLAGYARQASERPGFPMSRRWAARWDASLLMQEEPTWVGRSDASLVVAGSERETLIHLGATAHRIVTIPNGVERPEQRRTSRPAEYPVKLPVVAFVGNLGYAPNEDGALWFLDHVWPLVERRVPQAVFVAVGGNPSRALLKRNNGRDVRIRGYVPEIVPYVAHATVTVAPLQVASGFQNKVAQSLVHGVPVVVTPQALKWLPDDLHSRLQGYGEPETFASAVAERLENPKAFYADAKRLGAILQKRYSWDASGRFLDALFRGLVAQAKR
jgi:glycosyltransferase involved in cell wall biosynthesis